MFKYRRVSYNRETGIATQVQLNMTSIRLYELTGQMGINAFAALLNKWNRQNTIESPVVNVYVMEN